MIPLQIDLAGTKLLDYGVLGLVLFGVCYFAWHLFKTQQKYTDEWRTEAKEMSKAVVSISNEQNKINHRQVEIQEKQTAQTKEFYDSLSQKVDGMPEKFIKEWRYSQLQDQQNNPHNTPAP